MVCAAGALVGKLYYIDVQADDHAAAAVSTASDELWHQQLIPVNAFSIKNISK